MLSICQMKIKLQKSCGSGLRLPKTGYSPLEKKPDPDPEPTKHI